MRSGNVRRRVYKASGGQAPFSPLLERTRRPSVFFHMDDIARWSGVCGRSSGAGANDCRSFERGVSDVVFTARGTPLLCRDRDGFEWAEGDESESWQRRPSNVGGRGVGK